MSRTWRLARAAAEPGLLLGTAAGTVPQGGLHGHRRGAATVYRGSALQPGQGIAPMRFDEHDRPVVSRGGQAGSAPPHQSAPRWQALSGQHVAWSAPSSSRRMRTWTPDAFALGADPRVARTRTDRMAVTSGRVNAFGPCSEPSWSTDEPSRPGGQHERTPVVGNRRIRRKNQRSFAESFSRSTRIMCRTPVPATYLASSLARCRRNPSGLYDQPIPASPFRPLLGSRLIWNRVPSRVIESPSPEGRAESARGLR